MSKINHSVKGLPEDVYIVTERNGKFFPKMRGEFFSEFGGNRGTRIVFFNTLEEAEKSLISFVSRMQ